MRSRLKINTIIATPSKPPELTFLNSPKFLGEELTPSPMTPITITNSPEIYTPRGIDKFLLKNLFEEKYEICEKLGEGANGVVKRCVDRNTGEVFAVKMGTMEEEHIVTLRSIVSIMKKLRHPNILQMKELYVDSHRSKYYHIIEYLPHNSLRKVISQSSEFFPNRVKKIIRQLLSGLEYLHKHHIVHRDIKTSNLLYDPHDEHLWIIDLGIITKTVQRGKRRNLWSNTGTLEYKAPEMLLGQSYNESVDVWASGVVLYELVEGRTPFKAECQMDII